MIITADPRSVNVVHDCHFNFSFFRQSPSSVKCKYLMLNDIIIIYDDDIEIYEINKTKIIQKIKIDDFGPLGVLDLTKTCVTHGSDNIFIVITETEIYENTYTSSELLLTKLEIIENY